MRKKAAFFAKHLNVNKEDLFVSCTYIGVRTADDTLDVGRGAFDADTVEFQRTLRT